MDLSFPIVLLIFLLFSVLGLIQFILVIYNDISMFGLRTANILGGLIVGGFSMVTLGIIIITIGLILKELL